MKKPSIFAIMGLNPSHKGKGDSGISNGNRSHHF